jgi:hypothetical protein
MAARLSSPALRTLILDQSSELATYNSAELPDGATAFDNQSDTLFRLDKAAGTVYDALLGSGLLVKPDDQSDARWFAVAVSDSSPYYNSSYLNSPVLVTMTGQQWAYLGNIAGSFLLSTGSSATFAVNSTTGEVTYHGPPRLALVSVTVSLLNGVTSDDIIVQACISRSNDVVAGSTTSYPENGEQEAEFADVVTQMKVERIMLLNPGTTLRLALRNTVNADDLQVVFYQMSVVPL